MTDAEFLTALEAGKGGALTEVRNPAPKRFFAATAAADLVETMRRLRGSFGFTHLSTITGLDLGQEFELLYHLTEPWASLTVRTRIPRENPRLPTVTGVLPGAVLYERELQDMFGIAVDGLPDARPLVLPDDWPAGQFPLRKDWTFTPPAEVIPGTPEEKK